MARLNPLSSVEETKNRERKRDRAARWWHDAKTTFGLRVLSVLTALSGIALFMSESKTIMAGFDAGVKMIVAELHDPSHWSANITSKILSAALRRYAGDNETADLLFLNNG